MEEEEKNGKVWGAQLEDMSNFAHLKCSTCGMHVTGDRKLPTVAQLELTHMITKSLSGTQNKKDVIPIAEPGTKSRQLIEEKLFTNEHNQMVLSIKLEKCQLKYEEALIAKKLITYLDEEVNEMEKSEVERLSGIKRKAEATRKKYGIVLREKLTNKLLTLRNEEIVLRSELLEALSKE